MGSLPRSHHLILLAYEVSWSGKTGQQLRAVQAQIVAPVVVPGEGGGARLLIDGTGATRADRCGLTTRGAGGGTGSREDVHPMFFASS